MESRGPCTYVTRDWGVHDDRWVSALADLGFEVTTLSLTRDHLSQQTLKEVLESGGGPILAGPLDSVTHLIATTNTAHAHTPHARPLVGLSWGFDLIDMHQRGEGLAWLTRLTGLIIDSPETAAIATGAGVNPDRITYIPWGVDLETFTPNGPRNSPADFGFAPNTRLIVTLRAHEPRYRNQDVVAAFAEIARTTDSCALLIGHSGSQTPALIHMTDELGIGDRVRFLGTLTEADLPPLLRAAAAYVTASEVDGTSVTLLQAMACGSPVVASDSTGNRAWVRPRESGRLFRLADLASLTEAIRDVLDPQGAEETARMAAQGRSVVEENADWVANRSRLLTALDARP